MSSYTEIQPYNNETPTLFDRLGHRFRKVVETLGAKTYDYVKTGRAQDDARERQRRKDLAQQYARLSQPRIR